MEIEKPHPVPNESKSLFLVSSTRQRNNQNA